MSIKSLGQFTFELMESVGLCRKKKYYQSTLVLIYSGIDTMAWLNLPESLDPESGEVVTRDVTGSDFIKWVDDFLLPSPGLQCNAIDLYGARCGLVHTHCAESSLSRKRSAREILYAYGDRGVEALQKSIDSIGETSIKVPVKIEFLVIAFVTAIVKYTTYLAEHPEEQRIAIERAGKFLVKEETKI